MLRFSVFILSLLFLSSRPTMAQNIVNWAADVAPILYTHCVKCHRDNGLGHFSLVNYADAYSNRFRIQGATASKTMPPWMPDPSYRRYAHENRLTDAQIATIDAWVNAGAPAGDLSAAPPVPVFSNQSEVGVPDLVLRTPMFTVKATEDEYRCFVIPNQLTAAAYLRGLEALPGNHEIVHHILIYEDASGRARQLDQQTTEPGYVRFGGIGVNNARLVGAWAPGSHTQLTPPNMGIKLNPGADLVVQMHYPKGSHNKTDQTVLNLFFTPTVQNVREIGLAPLINHTPFSLENGPLSIPPNSIKTYHATFQVPAAGSVLSVAPHMHLIGRKMTCFAVTPQKDTIPLIRINDWNFHWQGGYFFQKVQAIPAFSLLHAYAEYDNTLNNPFQPSNPPKLVTQGEATTDEMLLVYFAYMAYQNGDENIVLDSTLLQSVSTADRPDRASVLAFSTWPNPVTDQINFEYEISEKTNVRLQLTDPAGRIVQTVADRVALQPGIYRENADVQHLPPGLYFATLYAEDRKVRTLRIIK